MAFEVGSVIAKVKADITDFSKGMDQVKATTSKLSSGFNDLNDQIVGFTKKAALVGVGVAAGLGAAVGSGVKLAGELEAAEQGFVALLGSSEKARAVMARVKREAAATPFEIPGLVAGTQALTAITKDGDKAIDILMDVGKAIATSGKGQAELDRVILNLQQVAATGKVTAMDIRQFQGAIPMFNDIIKAAGITTEELQDSENAAGMLFEAFKKAGAEGGLTAAGFTAQAGTFNQLMSNFKDSFSIAMADIATKSGIFDLVKSAIGKFTQFIDQNKDKIIRALTVVGNVLRNFFAYLTGGPFAKEELAEALTFFTGDDWDKANQIADYIMGFADALRAVGNWIMENQETVITFLKGLAIALGGLLVIGTISALIAALTNPIVLIVAAVGLLYTAWQTNFLGIRDITKQVLDVIIGFWERHRESFQGIIDGLTKIIKFFIDMAKGWWEDHALGIKNILEGAWNIIKAIVQFALDYIINFIRFWIAVFTGDWRGAWEAIKNIFKSGVENVTQIFQGMLQIITGILQNLFTAFKDQFEKIWNKAKEYAEKIRHAISSAFDKDKKNSPSIMDRLKDMVSTATIELNKVAIPSYSSEISKQLAGVSVGGSGVGPTINVNLAGAIIADEYSANRISEIIGDNIIKNLQRNVRF